MSHETIRFWWNSFGPIFAAELRKKRKGRMRALSGCRWHLDEVFVKINGERHYLWRAVDQEGEVLEAFVSKKRDRKAALKFLRKLMKRYPRPDAIIADRLRSYRAALRELGGSGRCIKLAAGGTIVRRIPTCRSGDENTQCSVSGGCEASRNLPPSILPSTTTSTCDDPCLPTGQFQAQPRLCTCQVALTRAA